MNFTEIHNLQLEFKRRLAALAEREVFPEITVNPPKGTQDELSFIRLVAWGYVLVFEAGKNSFKFLRQLPPLSDIKGPLLPHLQALRTWASHNLELGKKHDIGTVRIATTWLLSKCDTGSPSTPQHWEICFEAIANDLKLLLENAIKACDCFDKSEDKDNLTIKFKTHLERSWDAFKFDIYIENAFDKFGYTGLSAKEFRTYHLDSWRKIVVSSIDDKAIEKNLTIRIENDVLNLMSNSVPLLSSEIQHKVKNYEKGAVITAMLYLRELSGERLSNVQSVISELRTLD